MRQAAIEKIQTTCDAYQVKGQVVLHAVLDFQAAVCEGRDAASEEALFRDCLNILGKAAFDVRGCHFELEDPAIDWYAGIKDVGDALRALQGAPATATDPTSPGRQRLLASWAREKATLRAFHARIQEAQQEIGAAAQR